MAEFIKLITENDIWKCAAEFMKKFWVVLLVFVIALSVRVLYINQKSGLHIDESASFIISSGNKYGWTENFIINSEYTGEELRQLTMGNPDNSADLVSDLKLLWLNNNRDKSWTNFYYSILRISALASNDLSLKGLIKRGCYLNLIFFTLSFFYFFKLLQILFKEDNKKYIPFALFVAYMNTAAISTTLFIRSYQLQEAMLVIMTYIFANFYNDIKADNFNITPKKFLLTAFVMSLVNLSGYFAMIYEILLGMVLIVLCVIKRAYKPAGILSGLFVSGLIFANLLYGGFWLGFKSGRAVGCYKVIHGVHISLIEIIKYLWSYFSRYLFYPVVLLSVFVSAFFFKKKVYKCEKPLLWIIVGCAFVWSFVIMSIAPYKVLRYIAPVFPLIALVIVEIVKEFNFKLIYFFTVLYFMSCIFVASFDYDVRIPEKTLPFLADIENTVKLADEQFIYRYKTDFPVFIYAADTWKTELLLAYLNPHQKYKFVDYSFLEQKLYPKNCFIIYQKEITLPQEHELHKIQCSGYHKCFEITD